MKKKKVLFVVHQLNYGGVQKSLISALNAIDYEKNDVTLYIRKNRINLIDDVNLNVSQIIVNDDKTHYYRKPYVIWLMIVEFLCSILRLKKKKNRVHQKLVDYINETQMKYEKESYFGDDVFYDVAVSYVQGYTTWFVADYINAAKKIMFYHSSTNENPHVHKKSMISYDVIVGVNSTVASFLGSEYPEIKEKVDCLENYVDVEEVKKKSGSFKPRGSGNKLILCTCGRFAPVKGFDLALESAKILQDKFYEFQWYFVGDGPERSNLEAKIKRYGLEKKIIITGMQHNPYPYIKNCDVYVQSSLEEAQPLSIIEAMVLGRPIITTETIGGVSLIRNYETGLIVGFDQDELSLAIIRLADDKNLRERITSRLEQLDWEDQAHYYTEKWEHLLRGE